MFLRFSQFLIVYLILINQDDDDDDDDDDTMHTVASPDSVTAYSLSRAKYTKTTKRKQSCILNKKQPIVGFSCV